MYQVLATLFATSIFLTGCARPSVTADNPFEIDAREYDRVYEAARLVLADEGFRLDKQDYRFGRITTAPKGMATVFEPWQRADATLARDWQATLNDERRVITIKLDPLKRNATTSVDINEPDHQSDQSNDIPIIESPDHDVKPLKERSDTPQSDVTPTETDTYLLNIEVVIERHEAPVVHMTGSTRSPSTDLRATPRELSERGIEGRYWLAVGRDDRLERYLIDKIIRRSVHITK